MVGYDMKSVMQRDLKKIKTMHKQIDTQKQLPSRARNN